MIIILKNYYYVFNALYLLFIIINYLINLFINNL